MFEAPGKPPVRCASLWRLDADRSVHKVVTGVGCSNGLAWSPDSRIMYYTDSHTNVVWSFDFEPDTGHATGRRVFIDLSAEKYAVDGATVDAEGNYWLTVPFKSKVLAYDPSGKRIRTVELPIDVPTCCEFGGKNLDVLYVTSATLRRDAKALADQTKPGGLFAIRGLRCARTPGPLRGVDAGIATSRVAAKPDEPWPGGEARSRRSAWSRPQALTLPQLDAAFQLRTRRVRSAERA